MAVNDSGMFESGNFRDERLLWFEGAGVVGRYKITLDKKRTDVDLNTISDVTLHLRYTARDGGSTLAVNVPDRPTGGAAFFTAKADFAVAWEAFFTAVGSTRTLTLDLDATRLPPRNRGAKIATMTLFCKGGASTVVEVTGPNKSTVKVTTNTTLPLAHSAAIGDDTGSYALKFTGTPPDDLGILITF